MALSVAAQLPGCAVTRRTAVTEPIDRSAKWVLLPIANHTETPQAGMRAEVIIESLLLARGVASIRRYQAPLTEEALLDPSEGRADALAQKWAKEQGARYAVSGAVDEWRYKVGIDGEPAVGIALKIVDLRNDSVAFAAVGAKTGWSREALAGVAQKLIDDLLAGAQIR